MFNYVLNMYLSLVVNKVLVGKELVSIICMKNQQKIKALLNGTDLLNVKQWAKM